MTQRLVIAAALLTLASPLAAQGPSSGSGITIRTENYPRPPYSGATYYIYERGGQTICTKLALCNKFDECETTYNRGAYKAPEDVQTGAPYGATAAVPIPAGKLRAHVCLTRFGLI